jgi:hypothetical protein
VNCLRPSSKQTELLRHPRPRSFSPQPPYMRSQLQPMHSGCRTFSGHPPCWSRSLSPHMGGRSHPCATKASPESPLRDAGTVPCGAETPRGRSHPCAPLVAVTADQSPMRQTPLPNRPINECGTGAYESSRERVSCLSPLVFLPSFSPCSELIAALFPLFIGTWRRRQPGVA